VPSIIGGVDC